jgi:hypothetical protein
LTFQLKKVKCHNASSKQGSGILTFLCERSFSKLKFLKVSIRITLSQKNLKTLMLISVEKDILMDLDNNDIINIISTKSDLLKKVLQY